MTSQAAGRPAPQPRTWTPTVTSTPLDAAAFEAAGLYDPTSPRAADRLQLLEYLANAGVSVEWMAEVYATAGLTGLLEATIQAQRTEAGAGWSPEMLSPREIAGRAEVPLEEVLEYRRLAGLDEVDPDLSCLAPEVLGDLALIQLGNEIFGEEACAEFMRIVGAAASAVAQAGLAMLVDHHAADLLERPGGELATLKANLAASAAVPGIPAIFTHFFYLHLAADYERRLSRGADRWGARTHDLAVGFVDLVGSTAWSQVCPPEDQVAALADFEDSAWKAAVRHGGRIVKFIGDEAMFVAPDSRTATAMAVELTAEVSRHPGLPMARGAVTRGPITRRGGDYFGPVVNLASRATKIAEPGGVVVTPEVAAEIREDHALTDLGVHELRGMTAPVQLLKVACQPS